MAQGPAGQNGQRLRQRLAREGRRLPVLGADDRTANREYIRQFVLERDRVAGAPHALAYAEAFHYVAPSPDRVEDYVRQHGKPR